MYRVIKGSIDWSVYDDTWKRDDNLTGWDKLKRKSVKDYDGFVTDYTLYKQNDEEFYVCVFGDNDLYNPENHDWDFETESYEEAMDWFNDYTTEDDDEDY